MNFLDYINSYDICAINYVPLEEARAMLHTYPDVFPERASYIHAHVRFVAGKWISWCSLPYSVGDMFNCECVIDFKELSDEPLVEDTPLNIDNLL